ncbi:MAG: chemotaxis protein CheD [Bacillota bacterium]
MSEEPKKYFLQPGYIFVSEEPYLVHTVLGSCVSVCLWDSAMKYGGINHYIYSTAKNGERTGKYGDIAIPYLIKLMLEKGSKKENLKAHIVGGGENPELNSFIGKENALLAEKLLKQNKIEVITKDVYGELGRKVIFNTGKGEILIYKINEIRKEDWFGSLGK